MVGFVLFVVTTLLQVFIVYRIGRLVFWGYSSRSLFEITTNLFTASVLTFALFAVITFAGSFIFISINFSLALLLYIIFYLNYPADFVLVFILIFRLLMHRGQSLSIEQIKDRIRHQFRLAEEFIRRRQHQKARDISAVPFDPKAPQWEALLNHDALYDAERLQQLRHL